MTLTLYVHGPFDVSYTPMIAKLAHISEITAETPPNGLSGSSFRVGTSDFFVPLEVATNVEAECQKLKDELDYLVRFVTSVQQKLSNAAFIQNAPAKVVELEHKKERDALAKIGVIQTQLKNYEA